jgi:hypothetical protein
LCGIAKPQLRPDPLIFQISCSFLAFGVMQAGNPHLYSAIANLRNSLIVLMYLFFGLVVVVKLLVAQPNPPPFERDAAKARRPSTLRSPPHARLRKSR